MFWRSVVGEHFVASGDVLVKRSLGDDIWDSGAVSGEVLHWSTAAQGLRWVAATNNKFYFMGLSHEHKGTSWRGIDFALGCQDDGLLTIYERGEWKWSVHRGYSRGDELGIRVEGETVTYLHRGVAVYVSEQAAVFPLHASASFRQAGARAEGVRLYFSAAQGEQNTQAAEDATCKRVPQGKGCIAGVFHGDLAAKA